jgi:hypothetical protein
MMPARPALHTATAPVRPAVTYRLLAVELLGGLKQA